ncbi:MAG TPA: hypothetical protein VIL46_00995, partial [Gemmataceae bacterium]
NPQEPMEGMAGANPTGNPSGRESTQEAAATEGPQPVNPTPPDPEAVKRSMELQLEQFKRNADNEELLKRIGMTREEYQRFIEAYERELARRSEQPADAADLRPGARGGSSAANQGARRVEAGTPGAEGDLSRVGPLAPPREFRNPFKNFREASRNLNPPSRE